SDDLDAAAAPAGSGGATVSGSSGKRRRADGLFDEVLELLHRVPHELVLVLVPGLGVGGRGPDLLGRACVVDVRRGQPLQRDGAADGDRGRAGLVRGGGDDGVGDVRGEHHPAARGGRVGGQQPQRGVARGEQRLVLQLLVVAAGGAERIGDREGGDRLAAHPPFGEHSGEGGQGGWQVDAHGRVR